MRMTTIIAAFGAAFLGATGVQAAAVSEKIDIDASPDKVWAAIGDYCGIAAWLPPIAKCEMAETGGKKVRTLTTTDGGVLIESLENWDDAGMSYSYRFQSSPLPVDNYISTIKVSGAGEGSTVEWSSTFDPKGVSETDARKIIVDIYRLGLNKLESSF